MTPFPGLQEAIDWGKLRQAADFCCLVQWPGSNPTWPLWRFRVSMERETGVIVTASLAVKRRRPRKQSYNP